jgi:transcriptional regulator with XRE-family HTH domain
MLYYHVVNLIMRGGSTINERIKTLRKFLDLSQEEFGARLGVGKTAISRLEAGINNVTEQMTKLICREFNVDYIWFTTGKGEMFSESDDDTMELIDRIMTGENEFHKNLFKTFAKLDEEELLALEKIIDKFHYIKKAD